MAKRLWRACELPSCVCAVGTRRDVSRITLGILESPPLRESRLQTPAESPERVGSARLGGNAGFCYLANVTGFDRRMQ
jgi:hypothetical protein